MHKVKFNLLVTTEKHPESSMVVTKSVPLTTLVPRTGDLVVVDDVAGFRATDVTFNYRSEEVVVSGKMELSGAQGVFTRYARLAEVRDQLRARGWSTFGNAASSSR